MPIFLTARCAAAGLIASMKTKTAACSTFAIRKASRLRKQKRTIQIAATLMTITRRDRAVARPESELLRSLEEHHANITSHNHSYFLDGPWRQRLPASSFSRGNAGRVELPSRGNCEERIRAETKIHSRRSLQLRWGFHATR